MSLVRKFYVVGIVKSPLNQSEEMIQINGHSLEGSLTTKTMEELERVILEEYWKPRESKNIIAPRSFRKVVILTLIELET